MFNWGSSITNAEQLLQCLSWLDGAQDVAILFLVCYGCLPYHVRYYQAAIESLFFALGKHADRVSYVAPGYYGKCLGLWDLCVTLVLGSWKSRNGPQLSQHAPVSLPADVRLAMECLPR